MVSLQMQFCRHAAASPRSSNEARGQRARTLVEPVIIIIIINIVCIVAEVYALVVVVVVDDGHHGRARWHRRDGRNFRPSRRDGDRSAAA